MKKQIRAAARLARLVHQHIQRQAGEVVGDGFHMRIFFHVQQLQVRIALVATLRLDRAVRTFQQKIADAARRFATAALDAHHVPLGRAQRAAKIAQPLLCTADAHDARDRMRAAHRAQAALFQFAYGLFAQFPDHVCPVDLQRGGDERHVLRADGGQITRQHFVRDLLQFDIADLHQAFDGRACGNGQGSGLHVMQDRVQPIAPRSIPVPRLRAQHRHAVFAAQCLLFGRGQRHRREMRQHLMLCLRQRCEKTQVAAQGMLQGELLQALGPLLENILFGQAEKGYLFGRGFDLPRFDDACCATHFPPPVICLNHAGWCCFAQARLTVPYSIARIVPRVQIAA